MSSFNNDTTREETQLPGAFPSEAEVLSETAGSVVQDPAIGTGSSTQTDLAEEAKNLASGAVTTATALGLAAKDAALAAKDAALPAANAATEAVANAAGYPTNNANTRLSYDETTTGVPPEVRDSIIKSGRSPEAAADVQAVHDKSRVEDELLAAARGTQSVHTVTGVPTEVTNSIRKSGRAPEAAADRQAVQDKSRMENELLSAVGATVGTSTSQETTTGIPAEVQESILRSGQAPEAAADRQAVQDKSRVEDELLASVRAAQAPVQAQAPVASSGFSNPAASRPHMYTQDTGSYRGSGTAVVLGTDTERAFPLGGARHEAEPTSTSTANSVPDFAEPPQITTGLETRPTTELSEAAGRNVDYSHGSGATHYEEEVQSHQGSSVPRSHNEAPIVDRVPVRHSQEETVGNGPGVYQTLSSGTPSGVRF